MITIDRGNNKKVGTMLGNKIATLLREKNDNNLDSLNSYCKAQEIDTGVIERITDNLINK